MDTGLPYIPENITVHLGLPNRDAPNVTVSFRDYIKNVASSEIYPTWEEEALKANILAQISFALNRVYLQYYRNRGYDFDITSTTNFDQKYIQGRDTFENVSVLVDELLQSYIRRSGNIEPLSTSFCNGTTVTCEGLSQWGSQELARQGLSAYEILQNYYGDDIEIVTDVPIRGITPSYPGTPLRLGSAGEAVLEIQGALNRIGRNYPAIPKIASLDGLFGPGTEAAVREFQEIFDLTPDGIVGPATWYKILSIYIAVTRLSELRSEGQKYTISSYNLPEVLSLGSSGDYVSVLQYMLSVLSEFVPEIPTLTIDGQYGIATRDAVLAFQREYGLTPSGIVGANTWDSIVARFKGVEGSVLDNKTLFPQQEATAPAVQTIAGLQRALRSVVPVFSDISVPRVTGVMDRNTTRAVSQLQNKLHLKNTGQFDYATRRALRSVLSASSEATFIRHRQYPGRPLYHGLRDTDISGEGVTV